MKKRLLSTLLALCMVLALVPGTALAVEGDVAYPVTGGNIYFDKAKGAITDCDESVTAANIPAKIEGVAVISIGRSAFMYCSGLSSVVIPDGVTSIGDGAFMGCEFLSSVVIPGSVTDIMGGAFWGCSSLTNVEIPDSVTSIGNGAFYYCTSLTSIDIPDNVTDIDSWAFAGCSALTNVVIPDCVTYIGLNVFANCSNLTAISVPKTNLDYCSVDGVLFDKSKEEIISYPAGKAGAYHIPNSVTTIGYASFEGCSGLTSVVIPNSVTTIEYGAFSDCTSLTSVTVPSSITYIEGSAFEGCTGLTSASLPNGITSIRNGTFSGCSNLTSVAIPDSVTSIGYEAFLGCECLKYIYYSGTKEQWAEILIRSDNDPLLNAEIIFNSTGPDTSEPDTPESPSDSAFTFEFEFGGLDPQTGDLKMSIVVYMNGIELLTIPLTLHLG